MKGEMKMSSNVGKTRTLYLYSDGGSVNNGKKDKDKPVYGAYTFIVVDPTTNKVKVEKTLAYEDVTNNQMELMGVRHGIKFLTDQFQRNFPMDKLNLTIISDSQYVIKGCDEWMAGWKRRGWKSSSGEPVKNKELWLEMSDLLSNRQINFEFKWVRGHKGKGTTIEEDRDSYFNEMCDTYLSDKLLAYRN